MNTHSEIESLLPLYGELQPAERERVDEHLRECSRCAARLAAYVRSAEDLARMPAPWPDRWARDRFQEALAHPERETRARPPRRPIPRAVWLALGSLMLLFAISTAIRLIADGRFDPRLVLQGRSPFLVAAQAPSAPDLVAPVPATPTPAPLVDPALAATDPLAWIKLNAIPFNTPQPGGSFADLMPLKAVIGNAHIVALGDAAYGTHESMAMKQRLLEFLVTEMGFNTLAVEAAGPPADLVNMYIQTGRGDPDELALQMTGGFRQTQEFLYTVRWLRAHNQSAAYNRRVSFRGFDVMQQYSHFPLDAVTAFLEKVDPENAWRAHADNADLYDWLIAHRAEYTARSSNRELSTALNNVRVLVQYDRYVAAGSADERYRLRNRYMADNVSMLLRRGGGQRGKIILWGLNSTLGVDDTRHNLGALLRARYRDDLVVLGSSFYRGSLNATTTSSTSQRTHMAIEEVPPPPQGTYEDIFQSTGLQRFMLDLRRVGDGPVGEWLASPRLLRNITGAYSSCNADEYFQEVSLARTFDVFIFLDNASPTTVLYQLPLAAAGDCS